MRNRKLARQIIVVTVLLLVICLGIFYKQAGYLVYERECLMYHEGENEAEKVKVSLKYRPIAAFFGRIHGELSITYRENEYPCIVMGHFGNEVVSSTSDGKYDPDADLSLFWAQHWYTDEDGIILGSILMDVFIDRLLPMDKMAIVSDNGYRIYSLPIDKAFKESVDDYRPIN